MHFFTWFTISANALIYLVHYFVDRAFFGVLIFCQGDHGRDRCLPEAERGYPEVARLREDAVGVPQPQGGGGFR